MKKLATLVLGGILLFGAAACDTDTAKTSSDAPDSVGENVEEASKVEETLEDGSSEIRQDQLNSDIRAREQRNDIVGDQTDRADSNLERTSLAKSESALSVWSKLEANIPRAKLVVEAEDGVVSIGGTVPDQKEYETVKPLAKEILGVKSVKMEEVKVAPPAN